MEVFDKIISLSFDIFNCTYKYFITIMVEYYNEMMTIYNVFTIYIRLLIYIQ